MDDSWTIFVPRLVLGEEGHGLVEIKCGEAEAIEYLKHEGARLAKSPSQPPWKFMELLKTVVAEVDFLGPSLDPSLDYKAINERVFPKSIRHNLIGNAPLDWYRGVSGLRKLLGLNLSKAMQSQTDMFLHFRIASFAGEHWTDYRNQVKLAYELETGRSTFKGRRGFNYLVACVHLPQQDKEFAWEALALQEQFERTLNSCLKSGKIIVGLDDDRVDRFLVPELAVKEDLRDPQKRYHFLASGGLPASVLSTNSDLYKRKREAKAWMARLFEVCTQENKRMIKDDVLAVVCQKFSLTENAALEVIKKTWPKEWGPGRVLRCP